MFHNIIDHEDKYYKPKRKQRKGRRIGGAEAIRK